jgi:hypothetical protein
MSKFAPFADEAASITIDKLTIENGTDCIALYGSLDLTRDRRGLAHAQELKAFLDQAVALLNNQADLPNSIGPGALSKSVPNPFN